MLGTDDSSDIGIPLGSDDGSSNGIKDWKEVGVELGLPLGTREG